MRKFIVYMLLIGWLVLCGMGAAIGFLYYNDILFGFSMTVWFAVMYIFSDKIEEELG